MTGRVSTCVSRAGGARELLHNPTQPHVLLLREQLILKCAPQVKRGVVQHALTQFLGYKYGKIKGRVIKRDKKRPGIIRQYLLDLANARELERSGDYVIVYTDESYVHQNIAPEYAYLKIGGVDGPRAPVAKVGAGGCDVPLPRARARAAIAAAAAAAAATVVVVVVVIVVVAAAAAAATYKPLTIMHTTPPPFPLLSGKRICIVHAITKDGPLTTRDVSGVPHYGDHFVKARGGKSLKPRTMEEGEHTAEYLFVGNTKGDYHESMNSQNFDEWVQQRLVPTFEAKYPGKKTILVLDNAPCVRVRALQHLRESETNDLWRDCMPLHNA